MSFLNTIRSVARKKLFCICGILLLTASFQLKNYAQNKNSASQRTNNEQYIDRKRLEIIEELSESLANDLLELSIATKDRNLELIAKYFPKTLSSDVFPSNPLPSKNQIKWIDAPGWENPGKKAAANSTKSRLSIGKAEYLKGWSKFLEHFGEIEDARFKVKEANFDDNAKAVLGAEQPTAVVGATGRARIAFNVIGRDINKPKNGKYELRVTNELEKVLYLDCFDSAATFGG